MLYHCSEGVFSSGFSLCGYSPGCTRDLILLYGILTPEDARMVGLLLSRSGP